jgi:8-oxo-dGTP pyrophosphatase MutT (NUDIX family)
MAAKAPYLDRLQKLLKDVAAGAVVLDIHWKGGGAKLKTSHDVLSLDLSVLSGDVVAERLPRKQPNLILIRSAWPYALRSGVVGQLNLLVDQEIPLVVVEEVADAFENYKGLASRYETQGFHVGHPLVYSSEIEAALKNHGFTPQTIETYDANRNYPLDRWIAGGDAKERQSIKRLPKFILSDIGIRRSEDDLSYPHQWSFSVSFKADVARHRVNAVASALLRRKIKGEWCLLIQKRHREKAFWESWELPQGHIAPGEVFQRAAARELREETGLEGTLCTTQPFIHEWHAEKAYSAGCVYTRIEQQPVKEFFSVGVFFDYVTGEPTSPEDRQFTWASVAKLRQFLDAGQIYPLNEDMVRRFVGLYSGVGH